MTTENTVEADYPQMSTRYFLEGDLSGISLDLQNFVFYK